MADKYKLKLKDKEVTDSTLVKIKKSWDCVLKSEDILGAIKEDIPDNIKSKYSDIMTLLHISDEKLQNFIKEIQDIYLGGK